MPWWHYVLIHWGKHVGLLSHRMLLWLALFICTSISRSSHHTVWCDMAHSPLTLRWSLYLLYYYWAVPAVLRTCPALCCPVLLWTRLDGTGWLPGRTGWKVWLQTRLAYLLLSACIIPVGMIIWVTLFASCLLAHEAYVHTGIHHACRQWYICMLHGATMHIIYIVYISVHTCYDHSLLLIARPSYLPANQSRRYNK